MSPWWSQDWIEHWGPTLFHSAFWPLVALGAWAARRPRGRMGLLWLGVALGLALVAAGLVALGIGQPGHVWGRLVLFGGLFGAVHASLLVAMVLTRRDLAPAPRGGVS